MSEPGLQFLTADDAARRLGVSRLRFREAVARGRVPCTRDNEGRMRFDLSGAAALEAVEGDLRDRLEPAALVDLLFDELEELQAERGAQATEIAALRELLERQDTVLSQAVSALESVTEQAERLRSDRARLAEVAEAALDGAEVGADRLEAAMGQLIRYQALLERATGLAETRGAPQVPEAANRALALLQTAVLSAETERAEKERTAGMLDRALRQSEVEQDAGQHARMLLDRALTAGETQAADAVVAQAEAAARAEETAAALALTEKAVHLATVAKSPVRRRGWLARLLGL